MRLTCKTLLIWCRRMSKPIQIKNPSEELYARVVESSERNFRSITQEAEARLEFSFDVEEALLSKVHQKWIDEAMSSGTLRSGSVQRLREIAAQARDSVK